MNVTAGCQQLHLDGAVVDLGQPVGVEQLDERGDEAELGIEAALERVDHVVGGDGLAVVELDALLEPDHVEVGGLGLDLLGQAVLVGDVEVGVVVDERLPPGDEAGLVGLGDDVLAVDDVVGRADDADAERAAGRAGAGRRRRARCAGAGRWCRRSSRSPVPGAPVVPGVPRPASRRRCAVVVVVTARGERDQAAPAPRMSCRGSPTRQPDACVLDVVHPRAPPSLDRRVLRSTRIRWSRAHY